MKNEIFPFVVCLGIILQISANPFENTKLVERKLSGGKPVEKGQFSYLVSILTWHTIYQAFHHVCENTLITEEWILTHQACKALFATFARPNVLSMQEVETNITQYNIPIFKIARSVWPRSLYSTKVKSAIGLYQLEKKIPATLARPAKLATRIRNKVATVIGWGPNNDGTDSTLHYFTVPYLDMHTCKEKVKDACELDHHITESELCTDFVQGDDKQVHNYDSGCPVQTEEGTVIALIHNRNYEFIEGCPGLHITISSEREFIDGNVQGVTWVED